MEGRNGDTEIAHVNPEEKMLLAMRGGAGTVNPDTGMAEFYPVEQQDEEKANVLAEGDLSSAAPDKAAVEELKAIRDMIREAKTSGKVEDKKTLREITKRHKQLLENLIANAANPTASKKAAAVAPALPLSAAAERVAQEGRYGDTELALVSPSDMDFLKARGGSGTINPETGLPEFFEGSTGADSHGSNSTGMAGGDVGGGLGGHSGGQTADLSPGDQAAIEQGGLIDTSIGAYGGNTTPGEQYADALLEGARVDFSVAPPGFQGEAEISDQRNAPVPSYSAGLIGAFQDPLGWGKAHMQGFVNNLVNDPFGTIAGALAGAVVGAATKGIATGLAGPVAGQVAGMVASNLAGNAVQGAVTGAVANAGQQSTTSPNQSAPGTTTSVTTDPGFADDTRGGSGSGTAPLNYDARIAPLTSAAVTPLAVQPTTTIADSTPATQNPFLSGIYIPPIGAPTAGRPLAIT